jgi:predicted acetyltransferase
MIQPGENQYIEALKELWKQCFPGDNAEFIAFYFDKVYKNEETIIYLEDNKPIASLQIIPYSLQLGTNRFQSGYISGAMTHPAFRKKGYMSRLLTASFEVMKEKGYEYAFLIPQEEWLVGYYRKFGFVPAFPEYEETLCNRDRFCLEQTSLPIVRIDTMKAAFDFSAVYAVYARFLERIPNVVLKSYVQFSHILIDFFNDQGVLFFSDQGMAFSLKREKQLILKEFFYQDEAVKQKFLKSVCEQYPQEEIKLLNEPNAPFVRYKGMIKSLSESKEPVTDIYPGMMLD